MSEYPEDVDQKFELAYQLHKKGDDGAAFSAYLELAERGYSNCQAFIGGLYYAGKGTNKDLEKARFWLEKAAADNDVNAQFLLGKMVAEKGDYTEAFLWYEKSGKQGYAPALYKMAIYIEKGRTGSVDKNQALALYREAAEKQHLYAKRTLALRLLKGWGGFSGVFESVIWLYRTIVDVFRLGVKGDWESDSLRV